MKDKSFTRKFVLAAQMLLARMEIKMTKEIGKVTLDYKHYPGVDQYSDGAIEDEILHIVQSYSRVEFPRIIEESGSWPILYHLSSLRSNIIEWMPITADMKVLEIGSGCGAITGKLAEKAGSVTCVDLSDKRSRINAHRNQDCSNVYIHVGNFKDIEPELPNDYDLICLIGVFEYSGAYMGTESPYEDMLKIMQKHLKKDGCLAIAIENKFGLKYWAGCREDHLGTFFGGIENYAGAKGVRTFTRRGLERVMTTCDIEDYVFYYPYPDYKFMTTLYSDRRLPAKGELTDNLRNFDRDRLVLFHEKYAFDSIIEDDLFDQYSNSYMLLIGRQPEVIYAKYSNDRALEYAIKTEILESASRQISEHWEQERAASAQEAQECQKNRRLVRKTALSAEARSHIRHMEGACAALCSKYENSGLAVNHCSKVTAEGALDFEYIEGVTLEELLDGCLEKGDTAEFYRLFDVFLEFVHVREDSVVSNYDFIFSNILVNGEQWTLIDYEWTFGSAVPQQDSDSQTLARWPFGWQLNAREIAFRAVYCYILAEEKRNSLDLEFLLEKIGISPEEAEEIRRLEKQFQKLVTGKRKSMGEIRAVIGNPFVTRDKMVEQYYACVDASRVQIYVDRGDGYCEQDSYYLWETYGEDGKIRLNLKVTSDIAGLRIDPMDQSCLVKLENISWNERKLDDEYISTNGKEMGKGCVLFATNDPNINIDLRALDRGSNDKLEAVLGIAKLGTELAADVGEFKKKLWR